MTVSAMTTLRQIKRQQHLNKSRLTHQVFLPMNSSGSRGDVPLPGATSLHTHSAKFPIEREVILSSSEKESAKIPILTEYMRKAKPAAVAPDVPNIHLAWVNHKSMENLASHSSMNQEVPSHQVYKAEPMALVDSIGSEPSPIRPNDHNNVYPENGVVTSTPETESTKTGFPSRTYHSIKDMISSRFSSNKEKGLQTPQPPVVQDTNNTSLSPQSQLRQHGVYLGASATSGHDLRHVGRTTAPRPGPSESVYQTPTSYRTPHPHHHPQQVHQPQLHAPPAGHQETVFSSAGPPRPTESPYARTGPQYQDDWNQHQVDIHHHNQQQQQQMRYNGSIYGPPPRMAYAGNGVGPSRPLDHHPAMHHHHQANYSPVLRPAGVSGPHRSPMVTHRPPHSRPPSQGPPLPPPSQGLAQGSNVAQHSYVSKQDQNGQEVHQVYQPPPKPDMPDHHHHLYQPAKEQGRNSPQIYQLGKPPDLGRVSPTPQSLYQANKHQQIQQPTSHQNHTQQPPIPAGSHQAEPSDPQLPSSKVPVDAPSRAPETNEQPVVNGSEIPPEQPAPSKRLQPCGQESSENQIDKTEPSAESSDQVKHEGTSSMPPPPEPKKTEVKPSKSSQEQEDDDEGGFVKAGVQTDSGRGSTIYSSTKTKPSPEPGTTNGGVGEWADLVETELRNILGPGNAVNSNSLSESISSASPQLPPLSPAQSSDDLNFRSSRKGSRYESKNQAGSSNWRKSQHRSQNAGGKSSRNMPSSSLEIDSMLDENNSSDDDLDYTDVRAIRKQLEGLETMYSQVLKLLGVKKHGSRYDPGMDSRVHKRRVCGSVSSVPSSVSSRPIRDKRRDLRNKVRDIKGINKRFQRLESHVVTLARSVAHLSSEMRTQHLMMQEMEVIRSELASLRLAAQATRHSSPAKPTPDKVKKLTKFFGDEPPLLRLFLKQLGYEKYAPMFEKERIGLIELPYLTEERLHKLGIPLGPRLRIMQQAQFALATQHPNTLCIV